MLLDKRQQTQIGSSFKLINNFTILSDVRVTQPVDTVVAMAVYVGDKPMWVEQAVNSLMDQTYKKNIIAIVIDGDISDEILTYLVDISRHLDNMLLVRSYINRGLSTCMNFIVDWTLVNVKNAKYFFRMDSDDISVAHRLEKQITFLNKHTNISVLGSGLYEINEQGKKVGQRKLPQRHAEIIRFLPKRCSINHPTVVVRIDIFKKRLSLS